MISAAGQLPGAGNHPAFTCAPPASRPPRPPRFLVPPPPPGLSRAPAGGETQILRPSTLDFWSGFQAGRGLELGDLVELIPPRFNQLTVCVCGRGGGGQNSRLGASWARSRL